MNIQVEKPALSKMETTEKPIEVKGEEKHLLDLGIEAISLIKADGLYNQDIEAGRADALSDTEPVTHEELAAIDGVEPDPEHLKFYNETLVPKERARLHKQALYVAKGIIEWQKQYPAITPPTHPVKEGEGETYRVSGSRTGVIILNSGDLDAVATFHRNPNIEPTEAAIKVCEFMNQLHAKVSVSHTELKYYDELADNILNISDVGEASVKFVVERGLNSMCAVIFQKGSQWQSQKTAAAIEEIKQLSDKIKQLQVKYDENGYDLNPLIQLQRIEQHIDAGFDIWANRSKTQKDELEELKAENERWREAYMQINNLWKNETNITEASGLFQSMEVFVKLNLPVPNSI